MASLGHIAIGMVVARATRPRRGTLPAFVLAMMGWSAVALLPDVDVIGRLWGIRYGEVWGHGGRGCALFWPFDTQRYFAPFRPIPVAPIGRAFFSPVGWRVALVELAMFFPLFLYALWPRRRAGGE